MGVHNVLSNSCKSLQRLMNLKLTHAIKKTLLPLLFEFRISRFDFLFHQIKSQVIVFTKSFHFSKFHLTEILPVLVLFQQNWIWVVDYPGVSNLSSACMKEFISRTWVISMCIASLTRHVNITLWDFMILYLTFTKDGPNISTVQYNCKSIFWL